VKRLLVIALLGLSGCAAFDSGCADYYNSVCPTISFGVTLEIPLARKEELKSRRERAEEPEDFYEEETME
jgi:hypothetical protein